MKKIDKIVCFLKQKKYNSGSRKIMKDEFDLEDF